MENKRSKFIKTIFELVLLLLFMAAGGIIVFLYENNSDLQTQVDKRDALIRERQIADSIFNAQQEKNKSVVDKYISDCGILVNNKKLTTDELVQYMNKQINEINGLHDKLYKFQDTIYQLQRQLAVEKIQSTNYLRDLNKYHDSFAVYKSFYDLAKRNLKTDFNIVESNNQKTIKLVLPKDSLGIYRMLFNLAQRDYGVRYNVIQEGNTITYTRLDSKADSANILFEIYKDRLYLDSAKRVWYVGPAKKK